MSARTSILDVPRAEFRDEFSKLKGMTIARVSRGHERCLIAVVRRRTLRCRQRRIYVAHQLARLFNEPNIVLMAQDARGKPTYYGSWRDQCIIRETRPYAFDWADVQFMKDQDGHAIVAELPSGTRA